MTDEDFDGPTLPPPGTSDFDEPTVPPPGASDGPTGAAPPVEATPAEVAPRGRWRRRLGVVLGVLFVLWAGLRLWPAPADQGLTRPKAVSQTSLPQTDVTVDGVRLRVVDQGPRDAEVVLILPGHTSRLEEYESLVERLAVRYRVVVCDLPGSGYSEKPVRDYTLDYYEDTIVGLMDTLGIPKAHLTGGSQGGNLTLGVAARYPDRFGRLVPWSPGSAWPARPLLADAGEVVVKSYGFFYPTVKVQSGFWLDPNDPTSAEKIQGTFDYYDEVMGPGFVAMYWGIALDTVRRSLFDVAPQVRHPTLLVWGTEDTTPYMGEGCAKIVELLPRGELKVFEGSPHSINVHDPDGLANAILEFLARPESELP